MKPIFELSIKGENDYILALMCAEKKFTLKVKKVNNDTRIVVVSDEDVLEGEKKN